MHDLRLPGLPGLTNADAVAAPSGAEPRHNPERAFDAVMSRYASNDRATRDRDVRACERAAEGGQARKTDGKTAAENDQEPTPEGSGANPTGRPADRAAPADTDSESPPDTTATPSDPAALVAVVVEAAQWIATPGASPTEAPRDAAGATEEGHDARRPAVRPEDLSASTNAVPPQEDEATVGTAPATARNVHGATAGRDEAAPARHAPGVAKEAALHADVQAAATKDVAAIEVARQGLGRIQAASASSEMHAPANPVAQPIAAPISPGAATTYSIAHATITSPVGSPSFASDLAQRLVLFAGQKVQRAEIALSPAELGPLAVSIEVRGQEASLAFSAAHGATRAALEDALPRLRDMLSAQGLQLAGAHVGGEPRRDPYRPARDRSGSAGGEASRQDLARVEGALPGARRRALGLIDVVV